MSVSDNIHKTAIIREGALIADTAIIAPYCVIGAETVIGENTTIGPHTVISGRTRIGNDNVFHSFCSVGDTPQHMNDDGTDCELIIGNRNTVREFCTLHKGTTLGGGKTVIGNNNLIMAGAHVAHDCILGDHIIIVNNAMLGGHVEIGDYAVLGGLTLVHQWCKIGRYAFTGRTTALVQDLPPFVIATGSPARAHGLNLVGLRRHKFGGDIISALKKAYKQYMRHQSLPGDEMASLTGRYSEVREMIDFIEASRRGVVNAQRHTPGSSGSLG